MRGEKYREKNTEGSISKFQVLGLMIEYCTGFIWIIYDHLINNLVFN